MNDHDLSLLTDEERERIDEMITHARYADHVRWLDDLRQDLHAARVENANCDKLADDFRSVVSELSAARAENKRLLDGLVDMLPLANLGIVACERAGSNNVENMRVQHRVAKEAASLSLEARRALLHSEKGGAE